MNRAHFQTSQTPRNFIHPLLSRASMDKVQFEHFSSALQTYEQAFESQMQTKQSEPNMVTNALKPFMEQLGYSAQAYSQNGQSGIDLALMKNQHPAVIMEVKTPFSKEMISKDEWDKNWGKKSLHEAILYFMRERAGNNTELCHIIITDFYQWFIFDAKDFDNLFWRNPVIKKIYDTYNNPSLLGSNTSDFYQKLAHILPKELGNEIIPSIPCAYFNLRQSATDKEKIAICKLLSAHCLLKEFNPNDANSLNREFYNELLYILGLEEVKDGGKKIIQQASKVQWGCLFENIRNKLIQYRKPHHFDDVINLVIIWVNRILFLKLLESQVVKWTGEQENTFLHPRKINQYGQLEVLFFEVLAKHYADRKMSQLDAIPYLNSSLFEIHPDEVKGVTIATLTDDLEIDYYAKTVVKDNNRQRKTGKVKALPYFMEFLDAYDFSNDSGEEVVHHAKSLISASVLGLIFEKINGYKDGSFYTTSFITMYMARETVVKTIIHKFNQHYGWSCATLIDLHNKINDIPAANDLINHITICDPAVGSGHFLVSALNEILRVKSELGILVDEKGKRIRDYHLTIENDDLIIKSDEGEIFEYKKSSSEKRRIQKTIFQEKQIIIENCLFGVDINPNSVNICRLRLWVELLKNAYYKENGELDTLPNIDINIKQGNSLISRFGIHDALNRKEIISEIEAYKNKVESYKKNIGSKIEVLESIQQIKAKFLNTLLDGHALTKVLYEKLTDYVNQYGFDEYLGDDLGFLGYSKLGLRGKQARMFARDIDVVAKERLLKEMQKAHQDRIEIENGKLYHNAFEWRFEFPEVLNANGEFVGFDAVIGNPPYGVKYAFSEKNYISQTYLSTEDIYTTFFERSRGLVAAGALVSFITPVTWLTGSKFIATRNSLTDDFSLVKAINLPYNVFSDAYVDTGIYFFSKSKNPSSLVFEFPTKSHVGLSDLENISFKEYHRKEWMVTEDKKINLNASSNMIFSKVDAVMERLENYATVVRGILANKEDYKIAPDFDAIDTIDDTNVIDKRVFVGQLKRYAMDDNYGLIAYGNNLKEKPKSYDSFIGKRILVRRIVSRQFRIMATLAHEEFVCKKDIYIIHLHNEERLCYEYVLALLNSRLISYYKTKNAVSAKKDDFTQITLSDIRKLPIPVVDKIVQKPFIEKAHAILAAKQTGSDTSLLEQELDEMVYALYGLDESEIQIIQNA